MRDTIDEMVRVRSVPVLGICVGMQILAASSDEGKLRGLGWIDGDVRKFDVTSLRQRTRLPHMGWNDVKPVGPSALFAGLESDARFYFLHSYYFRCAHSENVLARGRVRHDIRLRGASEAHLRRAIPPGEEPSLRHAAAAEFRRVVGMLRPRIIPCLLVRDKGLVKTVGFAEPKYVGDPINAVKIFNEKEVDELMVLDIDATARGREPDYRMIENIAAESRMPLCYGGGVKTAEQAKTIIGLGIEKVSISSAAIENPGLISLVAEAVGNQSVVVVLDVKVAGARREVRGVDTQRPCEHRPLARGSRSARRAARRRRDRRQLDRQRRSHAGLRPRRGRPGERRDQRAYHRPRRRRLTERHQRADSEVRCHWRRGWQPVRLQRRLSGGAHQLPEPRRAGSRDP